MRKSLILLIAFCFALCMIFTACAKNILPEETAGAVNAESSSSRSEQTTSTAEKSTDGTTEKESGTKFYTKIRETQALQTEASDLQEKIDRNHADGLRPEIQQKILLRIGDRIDVPYNFQLYRSYIEDHKPMAAMSNSPDFFGLRDMEEYLPVYTYSGTEIFEIELNDEPLIPEEERTWYLEVHYTEGSVVKLECFETVEEIYEALPKGKYYVGFMLRIKGNDVVSEDGEPIVSMGPYSCEYRRILATFILELQ